MDEEAVRRIVREELRRERRRREWRVEQSRIVEEWSRRIAEFAGGRSRGR